MKTQVILVAWLKDEEMDLLVQGLVEKKLISVQGQKIEYLGTADA